MHGHSNPPQPTPFRSFWTRHYYHINYDIILHVYQTPFPDCEKVTAKNGAQVCIVFDGYTKREKT